MTTKQYLQRGYRLNELIKSHKEELSNLHDMVGSISATVYDKIGGRSIKWNGDTSEQSLAIKCVDLENLIKKEINDMVDLMREIHATIEAVQDRDQRLVLRCRYILFLNWEDTAARMSYSRPQARRIHEAALESVILPEKYLSKENEHI